MRVLISALGLALGLALTLVTFAYPSSVAPEPRWSAVQAETVWRWLQRAEDDGIAIESSLSIQLRAAIDDNMSARRDALADEAAMRLLRAFHGQCCGPPMPASWHIEQPVTGNTLAAQLDEALAADRIDLLFRAARPGHPYYLALADAHAQEREPERRRLLALNLARWRTLPLPVRGRYVIVNAAAQTLTVWEGTRLIDQRRVINGTRAARTPVFATQATGVVLNPWWIIPSSIAAEGIGAMVRRNPAAARERGYIYSAGRYRQMPGDNSALGRMKLVMPNPFTVFLHDTSNRDLFARDDRLLSHGCVRVEGAIDFAEILLAGTVWDRAAIDIAIAGGETTTAALAQPVPLFIAYFTAEPDASGKVRWLDDVYGRDREAFGLSQAVRRFPYVAGNDGSIGSDAA